jgi:hypothetical protein
VFLFFIYGLYKSAVSGSDSTALDDRMINKYWWEIVMPILAYYPGIFPGGTEEDHISLNNAFTWLQVGHIKWGVLFREHEDVNGQNLEGNVDVPALGFAWALPVY